MKLTGLHILLTYQCNLECDHCFVWGSPWQSGTMSARQIWQILCQARELTSIEWIYFEGGEPFLYYPILLKGIRQAARLGFNVGVVSNSYWATTERDAREWLRPMAGLVQDLSISSDLFHWSEQQSQRVEIAQSAAQRLGIPIDVISIAQPEEADAAAAVGQLPAGKSGVMFRGRAADKLTSRATMYAAGQFTECPFEDLREPGRVHVDPFGNLHICQGISLGNLFETSLGEICEHYAPASHPIAGPLLNGGPVELARCYEVSVEAVYADACHMCYQVRSNLRSRHPDILTPDAMYGELETSTLASLP
jgi:MoaA/NifB/PqqE/SkfB family radical SAM enzyme